MIKEEGEDDEGGVIKEWMEVAEAAMEKERERRRRTIKRSG